MIPRLSVDRLVEKNSRAEKSAYEWFEGLPDTVHVLSNVGWIEGGREGEADLIICDENAGILVVEVKGGGIRFDPASGLWSTTNKHRITEQLKRSPFLQAQNSVHWLKRRMHREGGWNRLFGQNQPAFRHAVLFPDVEDVNPLVGADRPRELIGGHRELSESPERWLQTVLAYGERVFGVEPTRLGSAGAALVEKVVFPPIDVRPIVGAELGHAEIDRIRLTNEQSAILRFIGLRKRALIAGGAGTGKTLVALEKAIGSAKNGEKVLLLCYNEPLAKMLGAELNRYPNVAAKTFHGFCGWAVAEVKRKTGRDILAEIMAEHPDWNRFDDALPEALSRCSEILPERFDAIIVDEGQDFKDSFWLPIELFQRDSADGTLYIFFDRNQNIYRTDQRYPIEGDPYLLSVNCRNAKSIHDEAYKYYKGEPVSSSPIAGSVSHIHEPTIAKQARAIAAEVTRLVTSEGVMARQIVVVVCGTPLVNFVDELMQHRLPGNRRWFSGSVVTREEGEAIRIESILRFKGLESDVVFLWGVDAALAEMRPELLYVGLSRAKTNLYIVGR